MKSIDQIIRETKSCVHNSKLYLIEKITKKSGLFCSDGDILYLVMNHEHCSSLSVETTFLQMDTDVFVQSFEEQKSFPDSNYNILRYKGTCIDDQTDNVTSFVNLCVAHSNLLNGDSFEQFFYSLISLFQLPKEQSYLNLEGTIGELLVIRNLFQIYQVDISPFWHLDGPNSKYDYSLPNKNAIEVKASSRGDKAISIKHSQLFSSLDRVVLASVHIFEDNSGFTLNELIDDLRSAPDYCKSLQFEISLQKELKRVSPDEAQNKRFCVHSIHYYNNGEINPFPTLSENVSGLEYKLDLTESSEMSEESLELFLAE